MISDPNLIYYACIARGTTILAEFNSKDADLGVIALKCLDKTPSFHTVFSHTVRNRTYLFLIDDPFSYFAIFDENLENPEGLAFLNSVKDAFNDDIHPSGTTTATRNLESLSSHCYQGEFNPVFRQLLSSSHDEMEGLHSPISGGHNKRNNNGSSNYSSIVPDGKPLLGDAIINCLKKKKKRFLFGDCAKGSGGGGNNNTKDGMKMNRNGSDACSDDMSIRLSRDLSVSMHHHKNGLYSSSETGRQKANKVWRKHVWVVLSMDLIICIILFVVWLCICRGFKCIIDA